MTDMPRDIVANHARIGGAQTPQRTQIQFSGNYLNSGDG